MQQGKAEKHDGYPDYFNDLLVLVSIGLSVYLCLYYSHIAVLLVDVQ